METLVTWGILALIALVVVAAIGFTLTRLYKRAERDTAFVRTGAGGRKVIKDSGALVLPVLHSIAEVKLNTVKLAVDRRREEALITADRMRVDIRAEFYVRVAPTDDGIGLAAQTLGERVNDPRAIQELVEAKLVDALRSVAARNNMNQLHEERADFVKAVQDAVQHDLQTNGLELESVSLTGLDQTSREFFNESNAFDAVGLTLLTEITEQNRKSRNATTRTAEVEIARRDLEASREKFNLSRDEEYARLEVERDVTNRTAEARAEQASAEQRAQQAEEEARITRERSISEREAEARRAKEEARINSERDVELANQARLVTIAEQSEKTSLAEAATREAQAKAVAAEEKVQTARDEEIANRARRIAVIKAQETAESEAVSITVGATAEKNAAEDRAAAILAEARAEADAKEIRAVGIRAEGDAEAHALTALNEARNKLDPRVIEMEVTHARIKMLPEALEALMRPVEKIGNIQVFDTRGFSGASGDGSGGGMGGDLADQLLRYTGNKQIMDKIFQSAGFAGANLKEIVDGTGAARSAETTSTETAPASNEAAPAPAATRRPAEGSART